MEELCCQERQAAPGQEHVNLSACGSSEMMGCAQCCSRILEEAVLELGLQPPLVQVLWGCLHPKTSIFTLQAIICQESTLVGIGLGVCRGHAAFPSHGPQALAAKGALSDALLSSAQPDLGWDRQRLHPHPVTGVTALLTSGTLTSFPGTGTVFS